MFDKKFLVSADTETHAMQMNDDGRITDGVLAPRLVCLTLAAATRPPALRDLDLTDPAKAKVVEDDKSWSALLDRDLAAEAFVLLALDPDTNIVFHNTAFDIAVLCRLVFEEMGLNLMPLVFRMYDPSDRSCATLKDTLVREKLIAIAEDTLEYRTNPLTAKRHKHAYKKGQGFFSLSGLVLNYFSIDLSSTKTGDDIWRLRYGELDDTPINEWPEEAVGYALDDAIWTLQVAVAQSKAMEVDGYTLVDEQGRITDEVPQTAAAWSLHLCSLWGVRTDREASENLIAKTMMIIEAAANKAIAEGIIRVNPKTKTGYSDNRKVLVERIEAAYAAQGIPHPVTDKGNTMYGTDVLVESGDPVLVDWGNAQDAMTLAKNFLGALPLGYDVPLISSPNVLVATGRTSWRGPNLQNPPRKGGYRECFIARPGYIMVTCDWSVAELCALAQVQLDWFGTSRLADVINSGKDVHWAMAAEMLGVSYEEVFTHPEGKSTRQLAKVPNFGLPGGLGAETFVHYAKGYGFELTLERAQELIEVWRRAWPESVRYLQTIGFKCDATGDFTAVQSRSGRIRGAVHYTNGANGYFQGMVSDIAKAALWRVQQECWADPSSPLYGSRPWLLLHDEILMESPEDKAHDAAMRLQAIMEETAMLYHPDVKSKAEPALMRRWYKGADPVYDENGRLIPWTPKVEE